MIKRIFNKVKLKYLDVKYKFNIVRNIYKFYKDIKDETNDSIYKQNINLEEDKIDELIIDVDHREVSGGESNEYMANNKDDTISTGPIIIDVEYEDIDKAL